MKKLACRWLTSTPPTRSPFSPHWSISMPALMPRGFLKMQPVFSWAIGRLAFLTIHCFCIRLVSSVGIVLLELELGVEDHQLVEAALAVGEHEVVALALDDVAGAGHHRGPAGPLADVAAVAAGVAVQCAADRAGNADQRLQPGQPGADRLGDGVGQLRAAAGGDVRARRCVICETPGWRRLMTMPVTPSSRTSTFEPPPSSRTCSAFVAAALDDRQQLVDRVGLGEELGRAAELEPGPLGQRHLLADAIDFGHCCHGVTSSSAAQW